VVHVEGAEPVGGHAKPDAATQVRVALVGPPGHGVVEFDRVLDQQTLLEQAAHHRVARGGGQVVGRLDHADALLKGVEPPDVMVVPEPVARRSAAYLRDVLLPHLLRAEAVMFSSVQSGHARWIAGFILSREDGRLALRDVVRAYGLTEGAGTAPRAAERDAVIGDHGLAEGRAAGEPGAATDGLGGEPAGAGAVCAPCRGGAHGSAAGEGAHCRDAGTGASGAGR
jgi:hypothetical protein